MKKRAGRVVPTGNTTSVEMSKREILSLVSSAQNEYIPKNVPVTSAHRCGHACHHQLSHPEREVLVRNIFLYSTPKKKKKKSA